MDLMMRRRALMGIGGKKESNNLILTYQASGNIPYTAKTCLTDAMLADVDSIKMDGVAVDTVATSYSINDRDLHTIEISFKEVPSTLADVSWNNNIRTIVIPNGVTSLPITFTYGCSNLTSVIIPDSVVGYGNGAFAYCRKLTELNIPEGVTNFYRLAMSDGLTSFIVPSTVTSISADFLSGCTNLNYVIFKPSTPPVFTPDAANISFNNTNDCPIFVPDGSVTAYKQALPNYETRIKSMSEFVEPTE